MGGVVVRDREVSIATSIAGPFRGVNAAQQIVCTMKPFFVICRQSALIHANFRLSRGSYCRFVTSNGGDGNWECSHRWGENHVRPKKPYCGVPARTW